jgi:hypothetical protein
MIESVIALLMFVNGEIKEHRIQNNMAMCLRVGQKQRYTWVKRVLKKLSYLNNFAKMLRDARFRQHRLNSKKIYNRKKYNIKKIED